MYGLGMFKKLCMKLIIMHSLVPCLLSAIPTQLLFEVDVCLTIDRTIMDCPVYETSSCNPGAPILLAPPQINATTVAPTTAPTTAAPTTAPTTAAPTALTTVTPTVAPTVAPTAAPSTPGSSNSSSGANGGLDDPWEASDTVGTAMGTLGG